MSSEPAAAAPQPPLGLPGCSLLSESAEQRLWACTFLGMPALAKQQLAEPAVRHASLARKLPAGSRIKQEVRGMLRARKLGVLAPPVLHVDLPAAACVMGRLPGAPLAQLLAAGALAGEELDNLLGLLGRKLAALHDGGLLHGDLSSWHVLVHQQAQQPGARVALTSFSRCFASVSPRDKGADLFVLEQQLAADHPGSPGLFGRVLEAYKAHCKQWSAVFNKLAEERQRSRKRAAAKTDKPAAGSADQTAAGREAGGGGAVGDTAAAGS